ncbi:CDGSH iron-sulfur domain-containing protein [Palaeococcus ferrophilus]|uniref:CDGSH iron-sulfur domain-containing protein n=1 Tax=Palaeococcus ferrophilus TaxID=83868 RepID=UPI000A48B87B|nr:CDGSH iron-sulfur domain-containing protein [Palaeococcus ferrophilus]
MEKKIVVSKDGPYMVYGLPLARAVIIIGDDGNPIEWREEDEFEVGSVYALCRCGHSGNKPFCDGTHARVGFDGTETARRVGYIEMARRYEGPGIDLTDAKELCAAARFCYRAGGTWKLVEESDDPEKMRIAIDEAQKCPSGRLVVQDKEGKPLEPELKPSLRLIEDPQYKVSGPIWVRGGVPVVSADGYTYEARNRMTLCRCGNSKNKPFCDYSHLKAKFDDGYFGKTG